MPILTRTMRYASRTNIAVALESSASAMALLSGETQGFAIDATTSGGSVAIIDTGTPANNKNNVTLVASNLVQTGTSAKVVRWNDGTLHTFAAGQIAQEYDGSRFGILIEQTATNICLRSQEINVDGSGNPWNITGAGITSVTANATTAPDGTATAELITEDTSVTTGHHVYQALSTSASTNYTISVFAKAGTRNFVCMKFGVLNNWISAVFDVLNGTVGETAVGATSGTIAGSGIVSIGNGWYRCWVAGSVNSIVPFVTLGGAPAATGNSFFTNGDVLYTGTSLNWSKWGAQVELGDVPTSYIATTTASVVRNPDVIGCATSTYPHSNATGTFIAWFKRYALNGGNDRIVQINDGTANERVVLQIESTPSPDQMAVSLIDGGVSQVAALLGGTISATGNKAAVAYALNDTGFVSGGAAEITDNTCTMPTCTSFQLGYASDLATRELNGYIYQMTYVPRRMTAVEMQTRTA